MNLRIDDFDYPFQENLIAQAPAIPRDSARLLLVHRNSGKLEDRFFYDLPEYLDENDVLVMNQTKVIPVRLFGSKETGGKVELLLTKSLSPRRWLALSKPGLKKGAHLQFERDVMARVMEKDDGSGELEVEFNWQNSESMERLFEIGKTPIPPYIHSPLSEKSLRQEYQTVFAKTPGSAAAPTAGMHFTTRLLDELENQGVQLEKITLHVGPGTFQKIRQENLDKGTLHQEDYEILPQTAERLVAAKKAGKRIVSLGTTTTRALESSYLRSEGRLQTGSLSTDLFIKPPFQFGFCDALITNFHLPKSSLLMLVTAFAAAPNGKESYTSFVESPLYRAYTHAAEAGYRFFSFGDAMLIVD